MRDMRQTGEHVCGTKYVRSALRGAILVLSAFAFGATFLHAQCPNSGETKVIKPSKGTGYYFYKFIGDSSYVYFLDGKTFSFNDKDDPGKTFIFIDDFAYEPLLIEQAELAMYVKSSNPEEVLRSQAKHAQEYFKSNVPSIVIKDYGPSARKNPDGSDDRLFYLWKKESAPGATPATQYLVSTMVKDGLVVLSIMSPKGSPTEDDFFAQIAQYTSHFDVVSSERCARVLAAPVSH